MEPSSSSLKSRFIHPAPHRAVTPCRENWLESHECHSAPESLRLFCMINGTRLHPSIPFFLSVPTRAGVSLVDMTTDNVTPPVLVTSVQAPCQSPKNCHVPTSSLSLSLSPLPLSHSQIYWSGIRITEAKRSLSRGWRQWKKTPGGENTACRRGAERKWKKYKEREEEPRLFLPHPLSAFTRLTWREWFPSQVTLTFHFGQIEEPSGW